MAWPLSAQEPRESSPSELLLNQQMTIDGEPSAVWIQARVAERELHLKDGRVLKDTAELWECFIRASDPKAKPRRVWVWERPLRIGGVGRPVMAATLWQKGETTTILLAVADSYYGNQQLFEIPIEGDLPPETLVRKQVDDDRVEPEPPNVRWQKRGFLQVDVPKSASAKKAGARDLSVEIRGGDLVLKVTPIYGEKAEAVFDSRTRQWRQR